MRNSRQGKYSSRSARVFVCTAILICGALALAGCAGLLNTAGPGGPTALDRDISRMSFVRGTGSSAWPSSSAASTLRPAGDFGGIVYDPPAADSSALARVIGGSGAEVESEKPQHVATPSSLTEAAIGSAS